MDAPGKIPQSGTTPEHQPRECAPVTPTELMDKADRAIASAKLLLDAGDVDGPCNRAYYAMFDAARAALLLSGAPVDPVVAKSHSGLISAFSLHLVKGASKNSKS